MALKASLTIRAPEEWDICNDLAKLQLSWNHASLPWLEQLQVSSGCFYSCVIQRNPCGVLVLHATIFWFGKKEVACTDGL